MINAFKTEGLSLRLLPISVVRSSIICEKKNKTCNSVCIQDGRAQHTLQQCSSLLCFEESVVVQWISMAPRNKIYSINSNSICSIDYCLCLIFALHKHPNLLLCTLATAVYCVGTSGFL